MDATFSTCFFLAVNKLLYCTLLLLVALYLYRDYLRRFALFHPWWMIHFNYCWRARYVRYVTVQRVRGRKEKAFVFPTYDTSTDETYVPQQLIIGFSSTHLTFLPSNLTRIFSLPYTVHGVQKMSTCRLMGSY